MKRYSEEIIKKLVRRRREGCSIPELMVEFDMPKTTIWHHVHNIKLSAVLQKKIRSKQGGSKIKREKDLLRAHEAAQGILYSKVNRELAIMLSMLYWAEGNKKSLVFTNTDPDMLRLYIRALKQLFRIKDDAIKLLIRISDPIKPEAATRYWCKELKLSIDNIKIDYNNKQNKTKTTYGICRIYVVKSGYYFKVLQCMIAALKSPRSSRDRTSHS